MTLPYSPCRTSGAPDLDAGVDAEPERTPGGEPTFNPGAGRPALRRRRLLMLLSSLLSAPGLLPAGNALAQSTPARADAWVSAVQMPGWIERAGVREPLSPGAVLRAGDVVVTGAGGRALVRLAEGSTVKLGESGRLAFSDLRVSRGATTVLAGLFDIAQGAFRFTTAAVQRRNSARDLQIRISTVTAGVRGTDLWGRGTAEREIVCLIEGSITVTRGSEAPIQMSEPLSFFIAPVGAPALPVAPVDPKQLAQWASETEPVAGAGAAVEGGRWRVSVLRSADQGEALKSYDALRNAGFDARIRTTRGTDAAPGAGYDVGIGSLSSQAEARGLAARLAGQAGVTGEPLVGR
jgi:hypothetical protein